MLLNTSINYLAVLVATIAVMALGMLWYGPLFGSYWMKLMNFTPKSVKKMALSPMQAMSLAFVVQLVACFVFAHLMVLTGATTITSAIMLAVLIWVGFICPLLLSSFMWEGKSINLWVFNSVHRLAEILVVAIILGAWQ